MRHAAAVTDFIMGMTIAINMTSIKIGIMALIMSVIVVCVVVTLEPSCLGCITIVLPPVLMVAYQTD